MMGTNSISRISCLQCRNFSSSSDHFRNGWRLRSGDFAQLCPRCASIYEDGKFCDTFHSGHEGWRDCESCGRLVHCGCIVSFNTYMLLDSGGIICMGCSRINFAQARNRSLPLEIQQGLHGQSGIETQYRPHCTDSELQQISRNSESVVTPLFEKQLSKTDVDMKLSRLVLPKRCAEAFFPDINDPRGFPIRFHDVEGKEWEFNYRYWINAGSKMYILEGLKEFMVSKRWEAGDTVTFFRVDPEGIFVIGLRKGSVNQPPNENSELKGTLGS
ncbi:OLC1v1022968C1 [Oldenlandia corymbosa var. corymbosa]|uniref:OLC1v1022968C1 n=1 Tax=Oldenlandia corymbosa var. corymbosa TaxID=529605 RepID=A0AAV1C2L6_OLDCO|nr:OLC1v1022968C1 [Oldenlandia corymbosa var. corymbosa]